MPTISPALFTINLAARIGYWEKFWYPPSICFSRMYSLSRSANFCGRKTASVSLPLFGARMITLRSSISIGVSLRTSPTLMQPRAMSSSMIRFRGFCVLNMISSTTSFSRILNWVDFPALNSLRNVLLSQGFWKSGPTEFLMKLRENGQKGES